MIGLSNDIVVYDSGSTDGTLDILRRFDLRLHEGPWKGFGKTRQLAVDLAQHDWVFILDADEVVSEELATELKTADRSSGNVAYSVLQENYLGEKHIRFGTWGHDVRVRLYHREFLRWREVLVHETLIIPEQITVVRFNNTIRHFTARNSAELLDKMQQYAELTARQYHARGKRPAWFKRSFGGFFAFVKGYLIKLGFLDGRKGYQIASIQARYTALKYRKLQELWQAHS